MTDMIIFSIFILCMIAVTSTSEALNVTKTELDALRNECTEKKNRHTRMDWKSSGLPTIDYCKLDASASDGNAVMFDVRLGPFELKPGMSGGEKFSIRGDFPFPPDIIHPDGKFRISAHRSNVEYLNGTLTPYPPIHIHHIIHGLHGFIATDFRCNPIEKEADVCKWLIMERGYSVGMDPEKGMNIVLEHLGEEGSAPAVEVAVHISIRLMKPAKKKEQETVEALSIRLYQDSHPIGMKQENKTSFFKTTSLPVGTSILVGYIKFPGAVRLVPWHSWHSHHYSNGGFVFLGNITRKGTEKLRTLRSSEDVYRLMNDTTTAADVRLLCEYGHNSIGSPNRGDYKALPLSNCALDSVFDVAASEVITTLCINDVSLNDNPPVSQHCVWNSHSAHLPIKGVMSHE